MSQSLADNQFFRYLETQRQGFSAAGGTKGFLCAVRFLLCMALLLLGVAFVAGGFLKFVGRWGKAGEFILALPILIGYLYYKCYLAKAAYKAAEQKRLLMPGIWGLATFFIGWIFILPISLFHPRAE